jgi:RNA methyltransferase, TrmH family
MISKARLKFIKSLQVKKYRKQEQCFVVEGAKGVQELLGSDMRTILVAATSNFLKDNERKVLRSGAEVLEVKPADLEQAGSYQTNDSALAVAQMRPNQQPDIRPDEFALVLDDIRDPGNLGTIIRTADWYGIRHIIASEETADLYNPKVISATMGSFIRVSVFYTDLAQYLASSSLTTYGAFLDGGNVHSMSFDGGGLIVIGNESAGISPAVTSLIRKRITIPRQGGAESLNASIATAVILDNIARSKTIK